MRRSFWVPVFVILIAGISRAQAKLPKESEESESKSGQKLSQPSAAHPADNSAVNDRTRTQIGGPLTAKEKLRYMIKSTYKPESFAFSMAGAGISQARNSIPEWGQGMEGFGKRFASSFGHKIVKRDIRLGLEILLHEDRRYFSSERQGIMPRTLFAVSRTFVSNKDRGGIRPGYSKFIATFGSAYISRQWYPERQQTMKEYLTSGAISIGLDATGNVFSEFWPDIKKLLHR